MPAIKKKSEEQNNAEAKVEAFQKDLGPFVVAAEATRMPMLFTDAKEPENPIIFANDAFLTLTGYARDEVLAHSFNSLLARGVDPAALAQVQCAFEGTCDNDPIIHYRRKDASEFWASVLVCPVRNKGGEVQQHFISLVDLTKHKEEQSHALMLIDELNHRVKNTLQAVQAIVAEAFRHFSSPEVTRESIEHRLFALSRSHDLLMSENWEGAGLHELAKTALESFTDMEGRADRIVVTGPNIHLPPQATLALGVAFHELAINAVKYGALSVEAGSVSIEWAINPTPQGERLLIRWLERDGPSVTAPTRKGFGSRAIENGLAHEMDGTVLLDFRPEGVVCTIDIPMPRNASEK